MQQQNNNKKRRQVDNTVVSWVEYSECIVKWPAVWTIWVYKSNNRDVNKEWNEARARSGNN